MTIFGKFVFGSLGLILAAAVFYGTTSYVRYDSNEAAQAQQDASLNETVGTSSPVSDFSLGSTSAATSSGEDILSSKKKTLADFVQGGGSYKCVFSYEFGTGTSKGTIYMHGTLIKGTFLVVAKISNLPTQTVETNMISRDGYVYTWTVTGGNEYRTKTALPKNTTSALLETPNVSVWKNIPAANYTCENWEADDSLFEIPKNKAFEEVR